MPDVKLRLFIAKNCTSERSETWLARTLSLTEPKVQRRKVSERKVFQDSFKTAKNPSPPTPRPWGEGRKSI